MLEMFTKEETHDGYGGHTEKLKRVRSAEAFVEHFIRMAATGDEYIGIVKTTIEKNSFSSDKCFLAIDCDSEAAAIACGKCLERDDIKWVPIESSPNHYWFLTDFVGTTQVVLNKLQEIVGVDPDYRDMAVRRGYLAIRAVPTPGRVPVMASEEEIRQLRDERVIKWILEYTQLMGMQDRVLDNAILSQALKEGKLHDLAADPNFIV